MNLAKVPLSIVVFVVALGSASGALAQRTTLDPIAPTSSGLTLQTPWGTTPVLAWSWGASSSGTFVAGGGGAGKANIQDLSLTRTTDAQSTQLLGALVRGTILTSVTLRSGSVRLTLNSVMVSAISTGGGSASGDFQTENVSLTFREFNYAVDGVMATCWDVATAAPPPSCSPTP